MQKKNGDGNKNAIPSIQNQMSHNAHEWRHLTNGVHAAECNITTLLRNIYSM